MEQNKEVNEQKIEQTVFSQEVLQNMINSEDVNFFDPTEILKNMKNKQK